MNKKIEPYISELLYLHDCVIVPNFGGFVGNKKSAVLNKNTDTIFPPSKEILFNKNLKVNDGLLISHLVNREKISNEQAKTLIEDFVNNINSRLENEKAYRIEKVGLLSIDEHKNILFLQDPFINYNLDSFGMNSQKTSKINYLEETVKKIVHPMSNKNERQKIWKAAAILLPIISMSLIGITQEDKINNVYSQMASLDPFSIIEDVTPIKNEENTENEAYSEESIILPPSEENIKVIDPKFYIIAGSFSQEENANKLVDNLRDENYNSRIVGTNRDGLIRVSYDEYSSKQEAISALNDLSSKNKSGWILSL